MQSFIHPLNSQLHKKRRFVRKTDEIYAFVYKRITITMSFNPLNSPLLRKKRRLYLKNAFNLKKTYKYTY